VSEIIVDTLTGKTYAGDITVTSEGGAATMQLQQGLCKHWTQLDTQVVADSLNQSSITDNAGADATYNFANNMSNGDYSAGALSCAGITNPYSTLAFFTDMPSTSSYRTVGFYSTTKRTTDLSRNCVNTFGDLA
jgi:hypothetical protein